VSHRSDLALIRRARVLVDKAQTNDVVRTTVEVTDLRRLLTLARLGIEWNASLTEKDTAPA
jgi:hypothetical protein